MSSVEFDSRLVVYLVSECHGWRHRRAKLFHELAGNVCWHSPPTESNLWRISADSLASIIWIVFVFSYSFLQGANRDDYLFMQMHSRSELLFAECSSSIFIRNSIFAVANGEKKKCLSHWVLSRNKPTSNKHNLPSINVCADKKVRDFRSIKWKPNTNELKTDECRLHRTLSQIHRLYLRCRRHRLTAPPTPSPRSRIILWFCMCIISLSAPL